MSLDEIISHEKEIAKNNRKIVETHIVFDDVTIDEMYCDDTEVIEEHLENYKKCAEYHENLVCLLKELKRYRDMESIAYKQGSDDAVLGFVRALKNEFGCQFVFEYNLNSKEVNKTIDDTFKRFFK